MVNNTYLNSFKIVISLGIILLILIIIKTILSAIINKKDIESARAFIIGNEEIQEDYNTLVSRDYGTLAVIADGLGKNEAGRIASITAVKTISSMFNEKGNKQKIIYFLRKSFNTANNEVLKRIERDKGGASVLCGIISDDLLYYALVGEAMLCIFRNNELVKMSEGHSMGEIVKKQFSNGKIDRDKAIHVLKEKRILYYMGQESFKNIEMSDPPISLKKDDIVVLMSRGVYENIRWVDLEEILSQKNKSLNMICEEITNEAEYSSNSCNGSIILMKYLRKKPKVRKEEI